MRSILPHRAVTEERLERALIHLAYIIDLDGPVYVPIFERLEKELAEMHRVSATLDRARRLRETYTIEGRLKSLG